MKKSCDTCVWIAQVRVPCCGCGPLKNKWEPWQEDSRTRPLKAIIDALFEFSESPGTMSIEECERVEEFFTRYRDLQYVYRKVYNADPLGLTLENKLLEVKRYIKFHKNEDYGYNFPYRNKFS